MELFETLRALADPTGPSGYEAAACRRTMELIRPWVDEVWEDRFGNVTAVRRCGKPNARRLLLDAHLDEVGLMVTGMEDGFLRFTSVGGVDPRVLPDREVTVLTDPPMFGVITCLPPHVQSAADRDKAAKVTDMFVDVGLSQEEAAARIPVGTPISFRETTFRLGEHRAAGKSMDDRSCFAALVGCAQLLAGKELDVDLYFLGSSREEVGGWGARTAAYALKPDWCVAVDVTHGATPDEPASRGRAMKLGGGSAVSVGPVVPRWMSQRLRAKAAALELPYQIEVSPGLTSTNADDFQISREGVATAVVSLPLRYMHTPLEVLDLNDLENLAQLLAAFVQGMGEEADAVC